MLDTTESVLDASVAKVVDMKMMPGDVEVVKYLNSVGT